MMAMKATLGRPHKEGRVKATCLLNKNTIVPLSVGAPIRVPKPNGIIVMKCGATIGTPKLNGLIRLGIAPAGVPTLNGIVRFCFDAPIVAARLTFHYSIGL